MSQKQQPAFEPPAIAIIGMAGRFPGARNVDEFWRNLRDGTESISRLTDEQLGAAGVEPALLQDASYVRAAAILDGIDMFDARFFGFNPKDAAIMDPQHRAFLECAWEALENAGWTADEFPGAIGVFAGSGMNSYLLFNLIPNRELVRQAGLFLLKQTGNDKDVLSTRVSYQLNLTGPSLTIQTACSTSLVAAHVACQSLLSGECDMALAGGVTVEIPHGVGYVAREGEILSHDGHCRAFDASASGTVFGSGAGIVVLRRLEDALRDGDCIRAVIRSTAINNDGSRKAGYLAPSVSGQTDVILEALSVAGIDAEAISYVETHGTGTAVGDPIEVKALTEAFRRSTAKKGFCPIGSLKTNIGHLDAAAGVASLIKTVLALENRQLPPSLNFERPNPLIDFENSPFYVNTRLADWKSDGVPRRAGVTSLGIGGTNAHVIVEEAPAPSECSESRPWQVITLSAKTESALEAACRHMADHLESQPALPAADVAFTCHFGRKAFARRRAVVCAGSEEASRMLRSGAGDGIVTELDSSPAEVAFLFPGQGSQYAGMARGIYETESAFRSELDLCAEILRPGLGLDIRTLLFPGEDRLAEADEQLAETRFTQPALLAIELALARLWMSWGIRPSAMIGHSIGEYAAACISGVFSREDALTAVAARGRIMQAMPKGAMLAAAISEQQAQGLLSADLWLAAVNGLDQCVLSGSSEAVTAAGEQLSRAVAPWRLLRTSHAFHSALTEPALQPFAEVMRGLHLSAPQIPYVSNLTGTWITAEQAQDPDYWVRHLRQTVRFADGLQKLLGPRRVLLECGPGRVLSGLAEVHRAKTTENRIVPSLPPARGSGSDIRFLMSGLARMWAFGAKVDWSGFHAGERRQRVPLPGYVFERERFWIDAPHTEAADTAALSRRMPDDVACYRPTWSHSSLPAHAGPADSGPWLIFLDEAGMGECAARQLKRAGCTVVTVTPGERFSKNGKNAYTLPPGDSAGWEDLIADLEDSGRAPKKILHLWSVLPEGRLSLEALDTLEDIQSRSFFSLLFLAQAIGRRDLSHAIELGVASNGLYAPAGEPVRCPERAVLLGPARVIPAEFPHIKCRAIDLELSISERERETVASRLIAELCSDAGEAVVAYRGTERWVEGLEPAPSAPAPRSMGLRTKGVYLITGGLGALGQVVAEYLARNFQAKLVLVGRKALPDTDSTTRKLEAAGAEVMVAHADVTDAAAMTRVIAEARKRFGALHGVLHAAGVLDDQLILLKQPESAAAVLAPKVKGTLALDAALRGVDLDFLALFSSVSSYLAPVGQIDYVAANAFLDAFARARNASGHGPTVSINWGRWQDLGMAVQFAAAPAEAGTHPVLGTARIDSPRMLVYRTDLSFDSHWVLHEHCLRGGDALFPGVGYMEAAAAAMRRRFGPGAVSIESLAIAAPLRVRRGQAMPLQMKFVREGDAFAFSAVPDSAPTQDPFASGTVRHLGACKLRRVDLRALLEKHRSRRLEFGSEGQNPKQARHIEFGPRWRSLRWVAFGEGDALSLSELREEFAAEVQDFESHPALLDTAVGSAMYAIHRYEDSQDLYVPVFFGRTTLFGRLPGKCYCHIRPAQTNVDRGEVASFDLTLIAEDGTVVAEIEQFSLRRLGSGALLGGGAAEAADAAKPASAITPSSGASVLAAILASGQTPQVVVVPAGQDIGKKREQTVLKKARVERADGGGADGPRDDVEERLAEWWRDLLGIDRVGIREGFFELGGHSLLAVRLLARIEKEFGRKIPLNVLFQSGTIEALAGCIRGPNSERTGAVVPMTGPAGMPFYCIPPIGGDIAGLWNLAKPLRPDVAFYGIQAPPDQRTPVFASSIEGMAAFFVHDLVAAHPDGPYNLGGWSAGAVIALEMAQQLRASGREVGLVVSIDGAPYNTNAETPRYNPVFYWKLLRNVPRWVRDDLMVDFSWRTSYKRAGRKMAAFAAELRDKFRPGSTSGLPRVSGFMDVAEFSSEQIEFMNAVAGALRRYVPKAYPGRVIVYQAVTEPLHHLFEVDRVWRHLASEVEVVRVPGNHVSLMQPASARAIAAHLWRRLETAPESAKSGFQAASQPGI